LVVSIFIAGVFITGAYPHNHLVNKLSYVKGSNQTKATARETEADQPSNETNSSTYWNVIQANNQALQAQLEQGLARIEQNVQKNKDLAEQIFRSPRAIQTIKALEAAIAIFGQNKPEPEYGVSEYATGNRCWTRSPAQHLVPIQDLLLYDVQNKHEQNKILGDKVAQVVQQNTQLAQQISSAYGPPQKSSRKTPSWDWSPRPWPHTCFSDITMVQNRATTGKRKISPHGENHFSKRRSESGEESRKKVRTKITRLKMKKIKRTRVKESWKVKADKIKAKGKNLERSETEREKEKAI
jgi:hypothetical protein